MSRRKLVTIGSVNLDLIGYCEKLPQPGETVTGATFAQFPGGKGANQTLAARRLGADVTMLARVGHDANAEAALELLRRDGVDLSRLVVDETAPTGVALIGVEQSGENSIIVASGANANLSANDIQGAGPADAVLCQLEVPMDAIEAASRIETPLFAMNLAPSRPVPENILARADLLIVNEVEAAFYGDALEAGGGMVAKTLGRDGAVLYRDGAEVARMPVFEVPVIDTVGAGDTFCAALALALAEGMADMAALRFASAAAALAVTKNGAQPSLPWREEVDAFLKGKA
jgi:ribokinase